MRALARALAGVLLVVAAVTAAGVAPAAAADPVPYTDFASAGSIGLCDRNGKPVTEGRITDRPFVWSAVSSVPPPAGYAGTGRRATLYIFQPRPKTYPPEWNGDLMTSASLYSNPKRPMAAATDRDFTLQEFLDEFKPMWNGILQLRMYVGASGMQVHTTTYPTTDIKVTGDTWKVVRGASVSCTSGTARPNEQTPPPSASSSGAAGPTASVSSAATPSPTASPSASEAAAPTPTESVTASATTDPVTAGAASGSTPVESSRPVWIVGLLAVLLAALLGAGWWARARGADGGGSG